MEGQGHFFTIYFPGFVCFVLYLAKISGERLQDHWSSGYGQMMTFKMAHSNFLSTQDFYVSVDFLFSIKTKITRKRIN